MNQVMPHTGDFLWLHIGDFGAEWSAEDWERNKLIWLLLLLGWSRFGSLGFPPYGGEQFC